MNIGQRKHAMHVVGALISIILFAAQPAYAQSSSETVEFDIPAQSLAGALREFLQQVQIQLVYAPGDVAGRQSPGVSGTHELTAALTLLTAGTGLVVEQSDSGIVTLKVPMPEEFPRVAEKRSNLQQPASYVEQITVMATRREKTLEDLPVSVSVMSATETEARAAKDFNDVANWLQTVQVNEAGLLVSDLNMRGIQDSGAGPSPVDIFFDGATIETESVKIWPMLLDVERIEVIRGPQGTLYGESSLAGVVQYLSVRPVLNEWQGSAEASGWTMDSGDSSWSGSAVLNIPLITDTLAARLGISYEDRGGFVDIYSADPATQLPDQRVREDANPIEREAWRAAIEWRPSDRLDLYLTARHQSLTTSFEARETMLRVPPGGDTLVPAGDFQQTSPLAGFLRPQDTDQDWATLEATFRFAGATLISQSTWVDHTFGYLAEFAGFPTRFFTPLQEQTNWSQELRLVSEDDDKFEWLVGAYWRDKDFSSSDSIEIPGAGFIATSESQVQRTQAAVFGNIMFRPAERWAIDLGLRLFREDVDQGLTTRTEIGGSPLPTDTQGGSGTFDVSAPRLAVSFDAGDNTLIYASVAKGFRGGSTSTSPTVPAELRDTDPDSNYGYEIGLKGHWLEGSLAGSAVLFYNDWDDIPVRVLRDINGTQVSIRENGDSAHTAGVEVDLTWRVSDAFVLSMMAHYMETEIDSTLRGVVDASALQVKAGNELTNAPKYSVAITGSLNQPLTSEWDGYLRADLLARGGSFSSLSNAPVTKSDSYQLGNLRIGVRSDNWDVSIIAHNIWNERAHFGHQANFLSPDVGIANIVDDPRRVGLAVRYRY